MGRATIETFLRYKHLLLNLITRDLKVKYRRSVLGILWSFLNPILLMLVLSAVFSTIFRNDVEYFPVYLISGQTLFGFFSEATNGAMASVVGSSSLIKKVYVPKYIFPMEKALYAFVNLMFSMVAVAVIMLIFHPPISWTIILFPLPLISLLMFSMGLGMFLSAACVFFRDVQYLYSVVLTAWTYLTPLFYPIDMLKGSFIYTIVSLNPLTWYVTYFRNVVLYGIPPTLQQNLLCFGAGALALVLGTWFFKSLQDRFILHI